MQVSELFDIKYGQHEYNSKNSLLVGQTLLISSQGTDNGCYGFFDIEPKYEPPIITVPRTGSIGEAFVQTMPCCVDDNCLVLLPKKKLSIEYLYYVASAIRRIKWKYAYGRQITPHRLNSLEVKSPEKFNTRLYFSKIKNSLTPKEKTKKNIQFYKMSLFPLTELCYIDRKYAPYLKYLDRSEEEVPYVTTTEQNNGIALWCKEEPNFEKGTITVSLDGSCGTTFYQFDDFISGEKTAVLTLKPDFKNNPYLLFYIAAIIRFKSWRYHYGRKLSMTRLQQMQLYLPVKSKRTIDFDRIEAIIKNAYASEVFEKHMIKTREEAKNK